ncbi:DUF3040 domain-containing protein [Streptomyces sp. NPDC091027]|uniref:DUF3040 domain-containing protein n=1 Tax=Streptomyces sp. NPDC091027 TaxID=3365971 RepID=UPI00381A679A
MGHRHLDEPDDHPLSRLAEDTARRDPRFAHGLRAGRPRRPYEYRHGRFWALLAAALAVSTVGVVLPHGLLLAAGLVLAGAATHLLASAGHRPRRP